METRHFHAVVYPPLLRRARAAAETADRRGHSYWLTSGLRTHAEQEALYALGRTRANVDATPEKPLGNLVTRARGGQSMHNFGLAVDVALDADTHRAGLQPDWRPEAYAVWGEEVRRVGLEWGGDWPSFRDYPHAQWPGVTLADCQREYARGGLQGLWAWIDRQARP